MAHHAALKESKRSDALGAINNLIRDDKVSGLDLLLQRPNSRESNDATDTDGSERRNVGAVGNLMRCVLVVEAVARQEGDRYVVVLEDRDRARGNSPGCGDVKGGDGSESFESLQSGATNYGNVDRR
jgi:hypothetical protein